MRELATAERVERFMHALGAVGDEGDCYFTGGATAVLLGWREATVDIDIALVPESDTTLRALPRIKEDLGINVELASPGDFIPLPGGWEDRSLSVGRVGSLEAVASSS